MKLIVEMRFGSHLYGTATPLSDLDYKGVYIPNARDILLQRVRDTISQSRPKAPGEKNATGDVDREIYSLQRYLELLSEGQTVALDMLFAPDTVMVSEPAPEWREIQANSDRLVTRRAAAFVRYCRQQANKYGIKGSRVAASRAALALLISAEADQGSRSPITTSIRRGAVLMPPAMGARPRALKAIAMRCGRRLRWPGSASAARLRRWMLERSWRGSACRRNWSSSSST